MQVVAIEEHWGPPAFLRGPASFMSYPQEIADALANVSVERIARMDAAGIDVQVLSLIVPGTEQMTAEEAVPFAQETNDILFAHIAEFPDRFRGFAVLPTADSGQSIVELRRIAADPHMAGVVINGHNRGRYLDEPHFSPLLAELNDLGLPIYLHPAPSPEPVLNTWYSGLPPRSGHMLSTAAWGWHVETGTHLLRMIVGGVFDRHPELQVIVGHMGELVPFMIPRYDAILPPAVTGLKHSVSTYLSRNVSYTFAGFNWTANFELLRTQVGIERIMFSVDYPFFSMTESRAFLDGLPVSPQERSAIASGNACRVLRIDQGGLHESSETGGSPIPRGGGEA